MLEGSSTATAPAGALSARYVAVKPCRVNAPSDVSRTKIEPDVDVIGGGSSIPVSEASTVPFESDPSYTSTKS